MGGVLERHSFVKQHGHQLLLLLHLCAAAVPLLAQPCTVAAVSGGERALTRACHPLPVAQCFTWSCPPTLLTTPTERGAPAGGRGLPVAVVSAVWAGRFVLPQRCLARPACGARGCRPLVCGVPRPAPPSPPSASTANPCATQTPPPLPHPAFVVCRAGRPGTVVSLAAGGERHVVEKLGRRLGVRISQVAVAGGEAVERDEEGGRVE